MLSPDTWPKLTSVRLLDAFISTSIPVTCSASVTWGTRVRSMTRNGRVRSWMRVPLLLSRVLRALSAPSGIQPEVVMVFSLRVMVFFTTGIEEKGYWVTLYVWPSGIYPP